MMAHAVDLLIILMALSNHGDHVSRLRIEDTIANRLPAVRDLHKLPARFFYAAPYIGDNILCLFIAGIIRCQDTQICQPAANLAHGVTPVL